MNTEEIPVVIDCLENYLIGIVHKGKTENISNTGVLIIVGGPQYRVGSHRQFVLLARTLAQSDIPAMRFDYRGMGDSSGDIRSFESVDDDIKVALDTFFNICPELEQVVIWGLCDAASAASFYAYQDERIKGLVLVNPWVFTEEGSAKTYLKYYYWQRIFSKDLWRKILLLKFDYRQSLTSLFSMISKIGLSKGKDAKSYKNKELTQVDRDLSLPVRMRECLRRFSYPVLFVLSGRDLTADEFREVVKSDEVWQTLIQQSHVTCFEIPSADHTFSSALWRDEVASVTLNWFKDLYGK